MPNLFDGEEVQQHPNEEHIINLLGRADNIITTLALTLIIIDDMLSDGTINPVLDQILNDTVTWATDVRTIFGLEGTNTNDS